MDKVVRVTDEKIFIGKDDGSLIEVGVDSANWDVKVGDQVEVFTGESGIVLSLSKKVKEKKIGENKAVKWVMNKSQKLLPIVFSSVFVFFMIALIVICSVPRGRKYKFNTEFLGMEVTSTITFKNDKMEVRSSTLDEVEYVLYDIDDGKIYEYNSETKTYDYMGKISSTKLTVESDGFSMVYKEHTMIALKTISIVFMVIAAILDAGAITVMILTKKGVLKLEVAPAVESEVLSEKAEEIASE